MKKVLAVLAVVGLASSAMAQSFEGRIAFRSDHTNSTTPNIDGVFEITEPGTYNFSILAGAFNAQGFTNYGMFNWIGDISGAGAGAFDNTPGTRFPFTLNPVGSGTVTPTGITAIDVARNPINISVPWPDGVTEPEPPTFTEANDQYFSVYRFKITVTDMTARDVEITASGPMQAIAGWFLMGGEEGAEAIWTAVQFVQDDDVSGSFTLRIVPAPGAVALLGLGGLVAARRRR